MNEANELIHKEKADDYKPEKLVKNQNDISRRSFLTTMGRVAFLGAAAATLGPTVMRSGAIEATSGSESLVAPEKRKRKSILYLDVFDVETLQQLELERLFGSVAEAEKIMSEMGISPTATDKELKEVIPQNDAQAKMLMSLAISQHYASHGEMVVKAGAMTREFFGFTEPDEAQASIVSAFATGDLSTDELGNPVSELHIDPTKIENMVAASHQDVVNISFEIGEFSIIYSINQLVNKYDYPQRMLSQIMRIGAEVDSTTGEIITPAKYIDQNTGNQITEEEYQQLENEAYSRHLVQMKPSDRRIVVIDGYIGEKTEQNLDYLVSIARKFPDKTFVAAAGNPVLFHGVNLPDIRAARQAYDESNSWPKNLIMVGVRGFDSGIVGPAALGADIYVSYEDLRRFGLSQVSSYATPIVSAIVQELSRTNDNFEQTVIEKLLSLTNSDEMQSGSTQITYQVLDFEKVRSHFSS